METIQMTVHFHCYTHTQLHYSLLKMSEMLPDRKDRSATILPGIKEKNKKKKPEFFLMLLCF